jgi:hypothetical protein
MMKSGHVVSVLVLIVGCASPPAPTPTLPIEAKIVGRYELKVPGTTVGTITSIVRCGDILYVGDNANRIHRLNISTGRVESPIEDWTLLPMALAADCDRGRVWVISPKPRSRGLRAVAFEVSSGSATRDLNVETPCFPSSATVSGDVLFVGGDCWVGSIDQYKTPPAELFYSDKRIGVQVSLASGETRAGLIPFEKSCDGAGACVGSAVAAFEGGWIASLPVSSQLGVYSDRGDLIRTVPVGSPGATARDGSRLASTARAEQSVQWSTRNSLIRRVFVMENRLVVAHYLTDVPAGWKIGSAPPQFKARINVLATDGKPLHVDLSVPELPVGSDGDALYVVDYGPKGRQGAHETVTVLRVAPPMS